MPRPRKNLPKGALEIIRDCASRGVTERDLANALGMDYVTWQRLREENPEAKQAYAEAKAIERGQLVGKLFQQAMDGNASAAMFLLKARHGYRDHGPADGDDSRVNITLTLPPALDADQYSRLIQAQKQTAAVAHSGGEG